MRSQREDGVDEETERGEGDDEVTERARERRMNRMTMIDLIQMYYPSRVIYIYISIDVQQIESKCWRIKFGVT